LDLQNKYIPTIWQPQPDNAGMLDTHVQIKWYSSVIQDHKWSTVLYTQSNYNVDCNIGYNYKSDVAQPQNQVSDISCKYLWSRQQFMLRGVGIKA
jgi:hypothetical protein